MAKQVFPEPSLIVGNDVGIEGTDKTSIGVGTPPPIISAIDHLEAALKWLEENKPLGNHPSSIGYGVTIGQLRSIIYMYKKDVLSYGEVSKK